MNIQPDPDILNLWVYRSPKNEPEDDGGVFEVSPNFNYDMMIKYKFLFNGHILCINPNLKQINDACYFNSYSQDTYVTIGDDNLFKFKKKIQTTQSPNLYTLFAWQAEVNLCRPPLAANIFTMAAVVRVNTNAVFSSYRQLHKDLKFFFTPMLEVADDEKIYNFQVRVGNRKDYIVQDRQWTIKQLLENLIDEEETNLPILCYNEPFFELKIAYMMYLEIIIPTLYVKDESYLVYSNGQRLTPNEQLMYNARSQITEEYEDLRQKFLQVQKVRKFSKLYCFSMINKDTRKTVIDKVRAYFVLFRDGGTFRMVFLN